MFHQWIFKTHSIDNASKVPHTSREFYTDTPAVFRRILHEQFVKYLPNFALYRDKSNPNYHIKAEHFIEVCAQFQDIKSFIHNIGIFYQFINIINMFQHLNR